MSKYNVFSTKAGFKPDQPRAEDGKWSDGPTTFLGYHSSKYDIDELSRGDVLDADTYEDLIRSTWYNYGPVGVETDDIQEMADWFESEGYGFTFVSDQPIMGSAFQASKYKYGDSLYKVYGHGDEYLLDDYNEIGATIVMSKRPLKFENQDSEKSILINGKEVKAGFKPDQARDENGKWTSGSGMSVFEDSIKYQDFESAGVYDKDGELLFKKDGSERAVQFTEAERLLFMGLDGHGLTHNHPGGKSFSKADLLLFWNWDMKEMRAVTKNKTYVLTATQSLRESGFNHTDISRFWDSSLDIAKKVTDDMWANRPKNPTDEWVQSLNEKMYHDTVVGLVASTRLRGYLDYKVEYDD